MDWAELDLLKLKQYIKDKTGYDVSSSKIYPFEIKLDKDIFIYIDISEAADLSIWSNPLLVHMDLQQTKGVFRGCGLAVDNFESLDSEIEKLIAQGFLWKDEGKEKTEKKVTAKRLI
jgi:hypothetical protein